MIWLVLASLVLGPYPDQILVFAFKNGGYAHYGPMPSRTCFTRAANLTRFNYSYYGPFQRPDLEVAFCISPPK